MKKSRVDPWTIVSIVLTVIAIIGSIHLVKGDTEKTVTFSFDEAQPIQSVKINADKEKLMWKLKNEEDVGIYYRVSHSTKNKDYELIYADVISAGTQTEWACGDTITSVFNCTRYYAVEQVDNFKENYGVTEATLYLKVE